MSRSNLRVRSATPGDVDVLLRFTEEMREVDALRSRGTARASRAAEMRARCCRLLDDPAYRVVLAVDDTTDEAVGAAIFAVDVANALIDNPSVYVSHLMVAPAHRRRGAGRALVAAAAAYADEMGYEHVVVGVSTTGREANRFFARLGFAPLVIRRIASVSALRRTLGLSEPAVVDGRLHRVRRRARRPGIALSRAMPGARRTG